MKFYLRKEESTVKTGSGSGFKCNTVSERSQKRVTRRLLLQIYTPRQCPALREWWAGLLGLQTVSALEKVGYLL